MSGFEEIRAELEALRDRVSKLSAASLHICASLDLDTVLQEAVDSARALTGARKGVIVPVADSGEPQGFVSSGLTADEQQWISDWPDGPGLFEHFRDLSRALRLPDLGAYAESLGHSSDVLRSRIFQAVPMRHRGVHVGTLFLADKEGGQEFSNEDEEISVLLASQTAAAIANARTYRHVERARADLEALVDTSPVGVLVLDARTGRPVSLNRKARQIVAGLRVPERSVDELLEIITCRRADGQEFSANTHLSKELMNATPVRAEEVVLKAPNGREITALINATPIRTEDGGVESLVVTLQDLAPLEELERLRTEFLCMVSHELRAPLTSIKGSSTTVLSASPAMGPAEMLQFFRIIDDQADQMRSLISDLLDAGRIEAGALSVSPELAVVADLVEQARRTFLSGGGRNALQIDLAPDLPGVLADPRRITQVLNNLLSNAARHSPESSPIRVAAERDGPNVRISVSDEGRGLPPDLLPQLFRRYARVGGDQHSGIRGSGLGLAICKGLVEAHGGRIWAESGGLGLGTRFAFTLAVADHADGGTPEQFAKRRRHTSREGREFNRILVVDDDPQTLRYVADSLAAAGYSPIVTGDPLDVSGLVKTRRPHLVLLDLVLPGTDGVELMNRVPELADLPVIFISGYGRDETVTRVLEVGAADYIVKPFSPTELVARVSAALRRRAELPQPFELGDLAVNYAERRVTVGGQPLELTATEYELLRELSVNAGKVSTYDTLLRRIWGRRTSRDFRPVRAFVKKLRQKLGDSASSPEYIFTERGVGYRMAKPADHR